MADVAEGVLVDKVAQAADAIDVGDDREARRVIGDIEAGGDTTVEARLARLFAAGLRARLDADASGGGNLYAAELDDGVDMIGAFDTLVSSTPFIRFAYAAANTAIAAIATDALHVVDIGIGEGTQWPSLLDALATRTPPPRVRLTGIDVPAPGDDPESRLKAVGARITEQARAHGIPFSFRGIAASMERITADDLDLVTGEALVVNLALALHHTSTEPVDGSTSRDGVLATLHALRPALIALVEPDSEHDSLSFRPRVDEALAHYGAIFRALDTLVPDDNRARAVLEEQFFGREIVNVVGFEGAQRVERHHRHDAWAARFRAAGFHNADLAASAAAVAAAAGVDAPAAVTVDDGMLVLQWDGTPLLSASAWMP